MERAGDIHFEDIVTCALSDADKKMLEGVLPYPSEELTDFSMPYLSGFFAKKYIGRDGSINVRDVRLMMRYIAGLE